MVANAAVSIALLATWTALKKLNRRTAAAFVKESSSFAKYLQKPITKGKHNACSSTRGSQSPTMTRVRHDRFSSPAA